MHRFISRFSPARRARGFTLFELMLVVAIVGILAGLAYSGYDYALEKSRRTEGKQALMALALAQERFRGNCGWYAGGFASGATRVCSEDNPANGEIPFEEQTENGYYDLAIAAASNTAFEVTATIHAGSAQEDDTDCKVLSLRQNGQRAAKSAADVDTTEKCW